MTRLASSSQNRRTSLYEQCSRLHSSLDLFSRPLSGSKKTNSHFPTFSTAASSQGSSGFDGTRLTADSPKNFVSLGQMVVCSIAAIVRRSEEHTSELQSLRHLVCRL